jgi:hypothetical protein
MPGPPWKPGKIIARAGMSIFQRLTASSAYLLRDSWREQAFDSKHTPHAGSVSASIVNSGIFSDCTAF